MSRLVYPLLLLSTMAFAVALWKGPDVMYELLELVGLQQAHAQVSDSEPSSSNRPYRYPGSPTQPTVSTRPSSWPGQSAVSLTEHPLFDPPVERRRNDQSNLPANGNPGNDQNHLPPVANQQRVESQGNYQTNQLWPESRGIFQGKLPSSGQSKAPSNPLRFPEVAQQPQWPAGQIQQNDSLGGSALTRPEVRTDPYPRLAPPINPPRIGMELSREAYPRQPGPSQFPQPPLQDRLPAAESTRRHVRQPEHRVPDIRVIESNDHRLTTEAPRNRASVNPNSRIYVPSPPEAGQRRRVPDSGQFSPREHSPQEGAFPTPKPVEGAQVLATVDRLVVTADEILGLFNQLWEEKREQIDKLSPVQKKTQRQIFMKQLLIPLVERKMVYADFLREVPPENVEKFKRKISGQFHETELPKLLKAANVVSVVEYDAKLRRIGMSLERKKQAYIEKYIASQWVQEQIKLNQEIPHEDLLDYYRTHLSDYEYKADARWQQIKVYFDKFSSRAEARIAIARMGNKILNGAKFEDVAKANSQGPTADKGGYRRPTLKGSLASDAMDSAIFGLPLRRLSQIIEDSDGLNIIWVIQRKEAGVTLFTEAQKKIRAKLRQQRRQKEFTAYLARLKKQIPVWTIFDEPSTTQQISGRQTPPPPRR